MGRFQHDPLDVLYSYFDGFLYLGQLGCAAIGVPLPARRLAH